MTTHTVTLTGLRAVYGNGARRVTALDGVTTGFASGTFTAVMGPSGSGKSTLLHCAAGLDRPAEGTVTIDGTRLDDLGEDELTRLRRDRIGFVFQAFNLVTTLTAAQNVELPLRLAGRRPPARDVAAALDAVGLADRAGHRPGELSGGEQQRVAIARAFVNRPLVLLADEPTGNLDPETSQGIMSLLERINRTGTTVVMATHDNNIVDAMRRRVIALELGHVVRDQARGVYGIGN